MKRQLEASMKIVVDAELLARDIPEGLPMAATEVSLLKSRALALTTARRPSFFRCPLLLASWPLEGAPSPICLFCSLRFFLVFLRGRRIVGNA